MTGTVVATEALLGPTIAVLCVESRPEIQTRVHDMILRALDPAQTIVLAALSTEDALIATRTIRFDLVISAYRIDGEDGQVFKHLKREAFDMDRFVFFTGAEEDARTLHHKTIAKGIRVEQFAEQLRGMTRDQLPWPSRRAR